MSSLLLFLIGVPTLLLLSVGTYRFLRKPRDLKVIQGAAFWLSGAIMVFVFVIFGFIWGVAKSSNTVDSSQFRCLKIDASEEDRKLLLNRYGYPVGDFGRRLGR